MSAHAGDRLPAAVRAQFGARPMAGEPAQAVILGSVDEDGSVRFAVLSPAEITVIDDKRLRVAISTQSTSRSNLNRRRVVSFWTVCEGAAYTIKGGATLVASTASDGRSLFEIEIGSVWRDHRVDAPMTSGPMYRAPQED